MVSVVATSLNRVVHQVARRAVVGITCCASYLAAAVVIQCVVFKQPMCAALEAPSLAEFKRDSSALHTMSTSVQGQIRVFRSETVNPAAVDKLPAEIGLPLILTGNVWRSQDRLRADYKSHRPKPVAGEFQESIAVDGGKVFQFSAGATPDSNILNVYAVDTPQGSSALASIRHRFLGPLDSLWSDGGGAFVDMVQRPETKIVPSERFPGGYAFLVSAGGGANARYEFEGAAHHPLGYLVTCSGEGKYRIKLERRVFSTERNGRCYPTRIVDVASTGRGGYTEVVMLDLRALEATSPLATHITPASFRNLGLAYQVYASEKSGKHKLAERYDAPTPTMTFSGGSLRHWFLWVNGCVVVALVAFLAYRYMQKRKAR